MDLLDLTVIVHGMDQGVVMEMVEEMVEEVAMVEQDGLGLTTTLHGMVSVEEEMEMEEAMEMVEDLEEGEQEKKDHLAQLKELGV